MNAETKTAAPTGWLEGRGGLIGLLAVQIIIGYVWLMSGATKIVRGGFPGGLADELREKSEGIGGWYDDFLHGTVIPNAKVFGVLIIAGELIVGGVLIAAAVFWLTPRWRRLTSGWKQVVLWAIVLASLGATLLNLSFHLANGSAHPWLIPEEGFDEGVDLDSIMPAIQLVLAAVSAWLALALRRGGKVREEVVPAAGPPGTAPGNGKVSPEPERAGVEAARSTQGVER